MCTLGLQVPKMQLDSTPYPYVLSILHYGKVCDQFQHDLCNKENAMSGHFFVSFARGLKCFFKLIPEGFYIPNICSN